MQALGKGRCQGLTSRRMGCSLSRTVLMRQRHQTQSRSAALQAGRQAPISLALDKFCSLTEVWSGDRGPSQQHPREHCPVLQCLAPGPHLPATPSSVAAELAPPVTSQFPRSHVSQQPAREDCSFPLLLLCSEAIGGAGARRWAGHAGVCRDFYRFRYKIEKEQKEGKNQPNK